VPPAWAPAAGASSARPTRWRRPDHATRRARRSPARVAAPVERDHGLEAHLGREQLPAELRSETRRAGLDAQDLEGLGRALHETECGAGAAERLGARRRERAGHRDAPGRLAARAIGRATAGTRDRTSATEQAATRPLVPAAAATSRGTSSATSGAGLRSASRRRRKPRCRRLDRPGTAAASVSSQNERGRSHTRHDPADPRQQQRLAAGALAAGRQPRDVVAEHAVEPAHAVVALDRHDRALAQGEEARGAAHGRRDPGVRHARPLPSAGGAASAPARACCMRVHSS
jgi:hypothetical protein